MDQEKKQQLQKAFDSAYFYLKFRPRTKKEMRTYLARKAERFSWPSDIVDAVLFSLEENKLINDSDFTAWFVEQRNATKQKSRYVLGQELLRFGVPKDTINEYFSLHSPDEMVLADRALSSRWGRFASLDKKMRFQKAAAFLVRRGFSFDVIKKTIAKYEETK